MPSAALVHHPATPCFGLRGIGVSVTRTPQSLQTAFVLEGNLDRLRIPSARAPRIVERLWEHTCCEVFITRAGMPGYREFNLSPSGEWAAYEFSGYRDGRPISLRAPGIVVTREANRLELRAFVPVPHSQKLSLGLCAVVEDLEGKLSYWALRHAPGKPDFHHPHAFALELDEIRH